MSYESQFQSIEMVENEIAETKLLLSRLVAQRDRIRKLLIAAKGSYKPPEIRPHSGLVSADAAVSRERSDGFWLGSEHR